MSLHTKLSPTTYTLKESKNLLGFSGGVDSVALFFLLLELEIPFDMAIVHYHTRKQADCEVAYAQELAQRYDKCCFVAHAPHFQSNFEAKTREFRFKFFDDLISTYGYAALLLAHQLNDHFEWFMMQLTRGAGLENLLGFEGRSYPIFRPLESIPKEELYRFCNLHNLQYFEDSSNQNLRFKRNYFRHQFCNQILKEFSPGIARSLEYLREDKNSLQTLSSFTDNHDHATLVLPYTQKQIFSLKRWNQYGINIDESRLLSGCDKIAKKLGYVISTAQRKEIIKSKFSCQIHFLLITNNRWGVFITSLDFQNSKTAPVSISPNTPITAIHTQLNKGEHATSKMDKKFKSLCAHYSIPPKLRNLLWQSFISLTKNTLTTTRYTNQKHITESININANTLQMHLDTQNPTSACIHDSDIHKKKDQELQNLFWSKVSKFFKP